MSKKSFIFFLTFYFNCAGAQQWSPVGSGVDYPVKYFYADSISDLLYLSGNLEYVDNINVNQIASWNGSLWDSVGHGMASQGGAAYAITKYKNNLYASGNIKGDIFSHLLGKWDGTNWDTSGLVMDGIIFSFKEFNGELIMGGDFLNAGNINGKYLASYDSSSWTTFPTNNWQGGSVLALEVFNNELYCGGNFYDPVDSIFRLAKWNGSSFSSIGNVIGGHSFISALAV